MKVPKKFEFMALSARGWLDELYRDANRVPAPHPLRDDLAKAMKWLGLNSFSDIKQKHYELWSAGFVCYLAEGKAPPSQLAITGPSELKRVFEDYSKLAEDYSKLAKEDPPPFVALDDEIRGVFARFLSVDTGIAVPSRDPKGIGSLLSRLFFGSR